MRHVPIPPDQIHGINETKLNESTESIASDYETVLRSVLEKSAGKLDLAVLGFGPDGHTCSLFPDHALLQEKTKWVAGINDSPKPRPKRITLTFPVLNENTRHVIFCGAGASKSPILQKVFAKVGGGTDIADGKRYKAVLSTPPPYPCSMVVPKTQDTNSLTWVVDVDAMQGVKIASS